MGFPKDSLAPIRSGDMTEFLRRHVLEPPLRTAQTAGLYLDPQTTFSDGVLQTKTVAGEFNHFESSLRVQVDISVH